MIPAVSSNNSSMWEWQVALGIKGALTPPDVPPPEGWEASTAWMAFGVEGGKVYWQRQIFKKRSSGEPNFKDGAPRA